MEQGLGFGLDFPKRRLRSPGIMTVKFASISLPFPLSPFLFSLCSAETLIKDFKDAHRWKMEDYQIDTRAALGIRANLFLSHLNKWFHG